MKNEEWSFEKLTKPGKYLIRPPGAKGEAYSTIITEEDIRLGMYDGVEWVGPMVVNGTGVSRMTNEELLGDILEIHENFVSGDFSHENDMERSNALRKEILSRMPPLELLAAYRGLVEACLGLKIELTVCSMMDSAVLHQVRKVVHAYEQVAKIEGANGKQ